MATVKKSTKAPQKKAPAKKAAPKIVIDSTPVLTSVTKPEPAPAPIPETAPAPVVESTLTPADFAAIATIAAAAAVEAVEQALKAQAKIEPSTARAPGGKVVTPKVQELVHLTPEAIAGMSEEQIVEYNNRETQRMAARKKKQAESLEKLGNMSTGDRKRAIANSRDRDIIRRATPPGWDGDPDDMVRVICKRRVGLDNKQISDLEEVIDVPREAARSLQSSGAVEVEI
jgi:hypothetical protein